MAVERYGSKTDIVVKLILVFFISLLSFSIGTFVGKKFSDNQHKIAQLEPSVDGHDAEGARELASVHPDSNEVKPKDALSDDEIKKLAEEFVADDTHKPAADPHAKPEESHQTDKNSEHQEVAKAEHPAEHTAPATEHAAPAAEHAAPVAHAPAAETHAVAAPAHKSEVAERVIAGKPPEEEKHEAPAKNRIPQSLPKEVAASSAGKFTVQVGSYPEEQEAQKISAELKDKGFSAFYVSANIKGKTYYRVSVGLFTTQKEADAYKKDLMARAKVSSAFVQKIQ